MANIPHFLQSVLAFSGSELTTPAPIDPVPAHVVPTGPAAQSLRFSRGDSAGELISVTLVRNGSPMRTIPVGAGVGR